jgi:putative lysine transport system substrate-binding protein
MQDSAFRSRSSNISVNRLTQAVHFFRTPPDGGGDVDGKPPKLFDRKVPIMKKIFAFALALAMSLSLAACGSSSAPAASAGASASGSAAAGSAVASGVEDGVLTVAMECAYAPYNWSQPDDSNGAVPIANAPGSFANGYDVMMAQKLCDANGWTLEVMQMDWDSLIPAVQSGTIDAVIAGQSMTAERAEQVDFAGPYLYATIVCLTKSDSAFASAKGISDLTGGSCTSQLGTIWYDTCLPQIEGAQIQTAAESAPAMLMALETGTVDFVCTDMPTAQGALIAYPDMTLLDFSGSDSDFSVSDEDVNIGISVAKGNTALKDALDSVLSTMTADDFNDLMAQAIAVQPIGQ